MYINEYRHMYIHIYIYVHTCILINIYTYIWHHIKAPFGNTVDNADLVQLSGWRNPNLHENVKV